MTFRGCSPGAFNLSDTYGASTPQEPRTYPDPRKVRRHNSWREFRKDALCIPIISTTLAIHLRRPQNVVAVFQQPPQKTNLGVGARSPAGQAARVGILGLGAGKRRMVIARVSNLSAAPFYLWGSGYTEDVLFPWASRTRKTHGQDGTPRRPTVAAQLSTD